MNWNVFLGYRVVRLIVEACVCMDQRGTPLGALLGGVRLIGGKKRGVAPLYRGVRLCTRACASVVNFRVFETVTCAPAPDACASSP